MNNLMISCTCCQKNKFIYIDRIKNWYEQLKDIDADFYVFVDGYISQQDRKDIDLKVKFINLTPLLGRKNVFCFPGWRRSFIQALKVSLNYDYFCHIENDVKIMKKENIFYYLQQSGCFISRCKPYDFLQSNVIILNDKNAKQNII